VFELIGHQQLLGAHVIAGPYMKKNIHWDMVAAAARSGVPDRDLGYFGGHYAVESFGEEGVNLMSPEPVKVKHIGAGFMLIPRSTFMTFKNRFPKYSYGDNQTLYFQTAIQDNKFVSEDVFFCNKVRQMGGHVWCCPWMRLQHFGNHVYGAPQIVIN